MTRRKEGDHDVKEQMSFCTWNAIDDRKGSLAGGGSC